MSYALKGEDADELELVEVDPTGRYGRYKEVLGKGAFKTVYRAFDQEDGIEVAWNQVQIQNVAQTAEDVDRLYSEVNLLKTLKHKNIIKFYHSWVDKHASNINFITEIFTSGTLRQFRKRHKHVEIKAVKKWSRQILRGLLYLHSHDPPIIHRDLKCDNIFIHGNQGEVKIGDLGLATLLHHAHAARSIIGTPEFMAPELYEEEYTELVDIYSFGMCLLEMVTAEYPYSECTNAAQIYKKVISGKKPEALKKVKDPELYHFIEKCLAPVSSRLPARELLMDPFLQCEESTGDCTSYIGRMKSDNSAEFNESTMSATVQIRYKLKETLSSNLNDCGDYIAALEELKTASHEDPEALVSSSEVYTGKHGPISIPKEDRNRSVDFRVKGKRREDDTVFLNLRIADTEGKVSNIHFPFDVESDTAMCVASEMVAELDLSDQDVTKIAEMIDAAILALVPEWRPGVAVDETNCDGEASIEEGRNDHYSLFEPLTTILTDTAPDFSSPSFSEILTASEAIACSLVDGTAYGRFEEVKYQCHRPLECVGSPDEECTVSSESSDACRKERMALINGCSSPRCYEGDDAPLVCETYNRIEEIKCDSGIWDADEAQELRELMLRHEQEMQDLQREHEQALLDFKKRWQQQKNMKPCSSSGVGSNCADSHQDMGDAVGQFFSEAERTSKVRGVSSLIGGLSSLLTGESLPLSSLSPLTDGRDCKLLTLQAQTETEGRTRCLTIQSQVMEQVA